MTQQEAGFLLLTSKLGNPDRRPLTMAQLRVLFRRAGNMQLPADDRDLTARDLMALGYGQEAAEHMLSLLEEQDLLEYYVRRGERLSCVPISRAGLGYPAALIRALGQEAPGCLWAKGDLSLLDTPMIALVGSRDLKQANGFFAEAVGREAARQGYTLVSGNARGADRAAQNACLEHGGRVISIVADGLLRQPLRDRMLCLSEDGFDEEFSPQRALSRNRCIHSLGSKTFVAQCAYCQGGTWDGCLRNLRGGYSPVYCFCDGSEAVRALCQMGAEAISLEDLSDFSSLQGQLNFLDR